MQTAAIAEVPKTDVVFKAVSAALVDYLVQLPLNHELHATLCADIYDMVNTKRDAEVARLRDLLKVPHNDESRQQLLSRIEFFEGN